MPRLLFKKREELSNKSFFFAAFHTSYIMARKIFQVTNTALQSSWRSILSSNTRALPTVGVLVSSNIISTILYIYNFYVFNIV